MNAGTLGHSVREPSVSRFSRLMAWSGVTLIASMAVLVQAYQPVKAALLLLFVGLAALEALRGVRVAVHPALVLHYVSLATAGLLWTLIGLLREGNSEVGAVEAMRLYTVWSLVFLVTFSLLRMSDALGIMHRALVAAAIGIALLNFVGLADQFYGWGLFGEGMRKELDQYIGFESGYIRIHSQNIGALFLVVPYLIALHLRRDGAAVRSRTSRLALVLVLLLTAASGRRALWLAVAMVPLTILVAAIATRSYDRLSRWGRRAILVYLASGALALVFLPVLPQVVRESGPAQHLLTAFSAQDERTIQSGYLLDASTDAPVLGSGFGAYAGYLRSDERPWTYEMTYHQLLFNLGLVGFGVVALLVLGALGRVLQLLRRFPEGTAVPFALVVGWCSILIGAWSNPYLRSFDYLFLAGVLPLLTTFERGFTERAS
jgi:hypothetical protein